MRIPLENMTSPPEGTLRWDNLYEATLPIEIFLCSFYLYVVFVLFATRKAYFRSGFFLIFKYTAVFDIISAMATIFYSINFRIGFNPRWNYAIALCSCMSGGSYMIHLVGGLLMTFTQLTAVTYPTKHPKIWAPRFVQLLFLVVIICCYAPFVNVAIRGVSFEYETTTDSWYYVGRKGYQPYMNLISSIGICVYEVVNLVAGMAVIIILRTSKQFEQAKKNIKETRVVFLSLIDVAFGVIDFMYETDSFFYYQEKQYGFADWFQSQFMFVFVLLMTLNSFSICLISKATREELINIWKKQESATVFYTSKKNLSSNI